MPNTHRHETASQTNASLTQDAPPAPAPPPPAPTEDLVAQAAASRLKAIQEADEKARRDAAPTQALLTALRKIEGDGALGEAGSSLMVAHMLISLGSAKVHAMTTSQAVEYVDKWRLAHPMMWPRLRMGDAQEFARLAKIHGMEDVPAAEYQATMSKVAPISRQAGFL
jgi:hypothetical protein